MPASYVITRDSFYTRWLNRDRKPVLHVKSRDTVRFEVHDVTGGQLNRNSKLEDYMALDNVASRSRFYALAGPVYIEGAKAGDSLSVHIDDMAVADWGWSGFRPGLPPLEEIGDYWFHIWDLSNRKYAPFKDGIRIPLRPFPGTIGVAPRVHGDIDAEGAYEESDGNMDVRYLNVGSELMLPVQVDGALLGRRPACGPGGRRAGHGARESC